MGGPLSFRMWLRQRRRAYDLTQQELADRVGCSVDAIYKFEAGTRRPSKQIAELLRQHFNIPVQDQAEFIAFARGTLNQSGGELPWMTAHRPPSNLPSAPTPLIGREQDIAAIRKRLLRDDTQLLTLVGPPGIGKTRLSLAVANMLLEDFSDGVFFVPLAPISDPGLVPRAIVHSLDIPEAGAQTSLERLKTLLRDKHMLLVLDNFEQILPAAPQIGEFLAACAFVKSLITSRSPLRIRRERQYLIPALSLPDTSQLPEVAALSNYAAVELFIERAQAVQPDFMLTRENGQSIAAICHRLDGLPLAIELLSARVKLLTPAALLERLHGRLMLQSDGLRDLEPRHRTLNAAIGWSYDLLDLQEKTLFMRLGAFATGFSLEAAEFICMPERDIIDGLSLLLDKSLIQQKPGLSAEPRFSMLETIREYALERLTESGEYADVLARHADFFCTSAAGASLNQVEQDYDNIRAALTWSLMNNLQSGINLAIGLVGYWIGRGQPKEGRLWVEKYLDKYRHQEIMRNDLLREMLRWAAALAYFQDNLAVMRQHMNELSVLGEVQYDPVSKAYALFFMGQDALYDQDFTRAQTLFQEALVLSRQEGLEHHATSTLLMLGLAATGSKDYERALAFNNESLALARRQQGRWAEILLLSNNALIWEELGDYQQARTLIRRSLDLGYRQNDKRTLSQILDQFAGLMSLEGEHERAARLMGAAQALRDSIFAVVEPLDHAHRDNVLVRLGANLDESAFATAWAEGRLMTLEQAMDYAIS